MLDQAVAQELVEQVSPGQTLCEIVPRTGGDLSPVYEIRCTGPLPAFIVKAYAPRWRWRLAKEVHVYRLLASRGVTSVPSVLYVDREHARLALTLAAGQPFSEIGREFGDTATYAVYRQLGAVLSAIHAIEQDGYGYLTDRILDPVATNTEYMTRQFDKKLAEFSGDARIRHRMRQYVDERAGVFAACDSPRLCHNDVHEGNMLVVDGPDGPALTGLIDVENATAADPLMDLAKADYYAMHRDPVKWSGLLAGYGPLPADWAARVAVYRLYHALELWDWFASIGKTEHLAGIAADIEQMLDHGWDSDAERCGEVRSMMGSQQSHG
ncbi:phosphotransferase family protein [Nocardia arthritidis]|uniref:Phosphotransferase n=1 Tax=Nocardia arthritidis TaxID=228602 RepID=A0A6G9YII2_9NOCA|nr:aminoglycoside phosphotransferase family protein [Nocardia arthritidis]QIS12970.1 phosphotransferase [Nocardia arthritidis]